MPVGVRRVKDGPDWYEFLYLCCCCFFFRVLYYAMGAFEGGDEVTFVELVLIIII